jgi:protein TonB
VTDSGGASASASPTPAGGSGGGGAGVAAGGITGGTGSASATGQAAGGGPGGDGAAIARSTPGAGESVDLGPYHEVLRRHIRDSLQYPPAVRRRGLRGTVEVDILVRADGAIRDVTLARSSSQPALDDAAIAALKRLPPVSFPPGLPPRALRVRVPVVFDLR